MSATELADRIAYSYDLWLGAGDGIVRTPLSTVEAELIITALRAIPSQQADDGATPEVMVLRETLEIAKRRFQDIDPENRAVIRIIDSALTGIPTPPAPEVEGHVLYETGDADAPDFIRDGNGEVVLGLCRKCRKAEAELDEPCTPSPAGTASALKSIGTGDECSHEHMTGKSEVPKRALDLRAHAENDTSPAEEELRKEKIEPAAATPVPQPAPEVKAACYEYAMRFGLAGSDAIRLVDHVLALAAQPAPGVVELRVSAERVIKAWKHAHIDNYPMIEALDILHATLSSAGGAE